MVMGPGKTLLWRAFVLVFLGGLFFKAFFLFRGEVNSLGKEVRVEARVLEKHVEIVYGQTLYEILSQQGIGAGECQKIIASFKKHIDPRELRAGQEISFKLEKKEGEEENHLVSLSFLPRFSKKLVLQTDGRGDFTSELLNQKVISSTRHVLGRISSSLYADVARQGVPSQVIHELTHGLSYSIHLQRDIQPDAPYELLYEVVSDEGGREKTGSLLYAAVGVQGKSCEIFRHQAANGAVAFFDSKGASVQRALLKTPLAAVRLTSGFGMRKHPLRGFSHMHKGVDFAAPRGTPVMAAGDGVVVAAKHWGGYGNYVRLNHGNGYETAYAHLNKIKVRVGGRISQGAVLGYVGSTGNSTGPHLHYEILLNKRHINPQSVKMPSQARLSGVELQNFNREVAMIRKKVKGLSFPGVSASL